MLSWILIGLFIIIAIVFIKLSHFRHRIFAITITIVILFLYVSVAYVANKNNLNLNSIEGIMNSAKIYFGWLFNLAGNFKGLTGSAIRMDWTSTNISLSDLNLNDKDSIDASAKSSKITSSASARFVNKK
jgi:hypothetical protein